MAPPTISNRPGKEHRIAITAECACRSFSISLTYPSTDLPHDRAICLCDSCRHLTGSCGVSELPIPADQRAQVLASLGLDLVSPLDSGGHHYRLEQKQEHQQEQGKHQKPRIRSYAFSADVTQYFCTTCGAHTLSHMPASNRLAVASGLLDRTEGLLRWTGCKWVEDTLDGGVSVWLRSISDRDANGARRSLKRWMLADGENEMVPEGQLLTLPTKSSSSEGQAGGDGAEGRLYAKCHCGGVHFYITRPNASPSASPSVSVPFPDLIVPYHTRNKESPSTTASNPTADAWWLRRDPSSSRKTRYLTGLCSCRSCRACSGFEIQPWAFVPRDSIFSAVDDTPLDFERLGTLTRHESSTMNATTGEITKNGGSPRSDTSDDYKIQREFCSRCGATVFWHTTAPDRAPIVDVSAGLFDSKAGARSEDWLEWWTERVSFREEAVNGELVGALEEGLRGWKR